MTDPYSITFMSNDPRTGSGYGVQTNLFSRAFTAANWDVRILAWYGTHGHSTTWEGVAIDPPAYDGYGQDALNPYIMQHDPDAFVLLADSWVYEGIDLSRVTGYCPIDADPCPPAVARTLQTMRHQWAMSRFAEREMKRLGLNPYYVPHAVDTRVFHPIDRMRARERFDLPQDAFVVAIVGANKGALDRKNLSLMIRAFAVFEQHHPDAYLMLHTAITSVNDSLDVVKCLEFYDIPPHKVKVPDEYELITGQLDSGHMNALYNASDVKLAVSGGEGFGVTELEAQAAGCPVIVSDWTAQAELGEVGYKVAIDPLDDVWYNQMHSHWVRPKASAVIEALHYAYENKGNDRLRDAARDFALSYDIRRVFKLYALPAATEIAEQRRAERETEQRRRVPLMRLHPPKTVSVITPWRDHPELIPEFEQVVQGCELILIDNASTAENSAKLLALVERVGGTYVKNEQNKWFAESNNQGLALATGDVVVFMNNDVRTLDRSVNFGQQVRKDVRDYNALYGPSHLMRNFDGLGVPYLEGWCIAAYRETWQRLGGWNANEYQGMYWEDNELCWRAMRQGYRLMETAWPLEHLSNTTSLDTPGAYDASRDNFETFRKTVRASMREGIA